MMLRSIIKRNNKLISAEDKKQLVLLDPDTNLIYTLNEVGQDIWRFLETEKSMSEIVKYLSDKYEVDTTQLKTDIINFVNIHKNSLFIIKP